ncbi:MAG: TauD/TfdA family dioxygenase [Granulosicoccus sp.]|nr:TauD/TfdA family dioxygenase [Granulosicoccus sp.]
MKILRQTPAIGAEITEINLQSILSQPAGNPILADIQQAFLDYHVLFFREQILTPDELVKFARLFGPVGRYPFAEPLPDCPEVIAIIKEPEQRTVFGGIWHTDSAYLAAPSIASVLYALEVPTLGGDTLFSSQIAAYQALDDDIRQQLAGLKAVHSSIKNQSRLRADHLSTGAMKSHATPSHEAAHPVVRTHPETGRQSLYISPAHTTHIEGMSDAESDELLERLFSHALQDDFKCRFRWQPGTLAIWDNRCTLHYPVNDYHGQRRVMHRVTIEGAAPV